MSDRPKRRYRHMTPEIAEFVRWLYFHGKLKQRQIGDMIGLRQGSVSRIVSGQVWNRVA